MSRRTVIATAALTTLALGAAAQADALSPEIAAELQALRDQVSRQQAQLDALSRSQGETWLNERRAEEVKGLVREVLADADTRASLLQEGATAGYDGGFFIKSADGGTSLKINGIAQVRYIFNTRDESDDDYEGGFQLMRGNLFFSGNIIDPKIKYAITLASSRADGSVGAEDIWLGYDFTDTLSVKAGRFRGFSFMREERLSYGKQLAVERSYVNEEFTMDYVEGIEAMWKAADAVQVRLGVNDGRYSGSVSGRDFNADTTDVAFTGRVDVKLAGEWAQFDDFNSWSNDDLGILVGAAAHYEIGETDSANEDNDIFTWTVDASAETGGFNVYGAVVARHASNDGTPDVDQWGALVQAGYMVVPDVLEPFARYEFIDFDGFSDIGATTALAEDEVSIVTVGVNYYLKKHNAKLTVDVVHALDPIPTSRTHTGLLPDASDEDGQTALRAQFQLLF